MTMKRYVSDFARRFYNQGVDDGRCAMGRAILRNQLQQRFGELPPDATTRLEQADSEQLSLWAERILAAGSLAEVFFG